ncbi:hypothetical protein [Maricaulis maris]|uniref:Uncharacterized protein n=1 Tax=Maricaulis maris TaxID=74318 RepID=A0A495DKV1_9PROT|nr:hypothetical protein [Maricaulis maris]RKR03567.1 hypothetical protein C7435_0003 [Maricaulis maris]
MDALLKAAWSNAISTHFTAVEIELPDAALRLVDGGMVAFEVDGEAQSFTSRDVTYGVLGGVDTITDGVATTAVSAQITLIPSSDGAVAALAAPAAQGSQVRVWQGAVDPETGQAIGVPERLFIGSLDFANLKVGEANRQVILQCGSDDELQLEPTAHQRLSHAFHISVWPGEYGLIHIPKVAGKVFWRVAEPRKSIASGSGGGGNVTNGGVVVR